MKGVLARVTAGDVLYDEHEDTELEVVEVFPARGVVQIAVDDETEFRDLIETLTAIRAGRLVRIADDDDRDATDTEDDELAEDGDEASEDEND